MVGHRISFLYLLTRWFQDWVQLPFCINWVAFVFLNTNNFIWTPSNNRHVRFPEDDSIILGCLEPFHPTPDNCTSDELIAAYIASCKLYKTPTVDFLLEQLRGIDLSICNERYSRLYLRGIKLSRFQIETLEEVFRRVHFQEVDLEDTFLDEASATALFDMMLHYETCVDLSISLNLEKVGPSIAWPRCITYLRKSAALQGFKLSHTPLATNLFSGLSLSGLSLKSLTFRDCALTGPPLHCLLRLLRYLMTYTGSSSDSGPSKASAGANGSRYPRPSYRGPMAPMPWRLSLHLPDNRIHGIDAESLLLLVRHQLVLLPGPPTPPTSVDSTTASACINRPTGGSGYLEELDLSHNSLRDEGVQVLCSGLLQAYELQRRRLDVALAAIAQATSASGASLTTSGMLPPKYALPQARGLQRLNLADNGLGGGRAGRHLAAVLSCSTERLAPLLGGLTYLDLSDNPGFGNVGVIDLCDGLVCNFTLRELYLRNVRIEFDGVFALSGYIGETKSLVHLDIRQNTVDIAGMMALTRTLKINSSLTALLLDARRHASPLNEDCDMAQILLQELDEYLRRNRNSQVAPPSVTLSEECETFSPKVQTAIERVSSTRAPEDKNNPEEAEIKEILLDPPKPVVTHASGISSPQDSNKIEEGPVEQLVMGTEKVFISGIASKGNEPLPEFKPKQEALRFHLTDSSSPYADMPIIGEVKTPIATDASPSETESLVKDLSVGFDHLKSDDASEMQFSMHLPVVSQPESEGFADEPSFGSKTPKLSHQEIAVSQANDALSAILANAEAQVSADFEAGEPEFSSLGNEPPMEFETFLMAQKEANYASNADSNEVEETPVNLSIPGQFINDLNELTVESRNIHLHSLQLGVEAEVFQLHHSKSTVSHFNDEVSKGSGDLEGSIVDLPVTDKDKVEHILERCKPSTEGFKGDSVIESGISRSGRNNAMAFQTDEASTLSSTAYVDGDFDDERPTKIGTMQVVSLGSTVPRLNKGLDQTSVEFNENSADLFLVEETKISTALGAREFEVEVPQDKTTVDHEKPVFSQTSGPLSLSSVDIEESSVNLPIIEKTEIPIFMGNNQFGIGNLSSGPPIEFERSHVDSLEPVMLQLKNTPIQGSLSNVEVKKPETGLGVEPPLEIRVEPLMAVISHLNEKFRESLKELEESPLDLPAIEDVKISTTLDAYNPEDDESWRLQAAGSMDFTTADVKEGPMGSPTAKELKASFTTGAGHSNAEDLGNEPTMGFEAFQSVHSELADHRTNDNLERGPIETESRIPSNLGAQTECLDRENPKEIDNPPQNFSTPAVASTIQEKSSSEDLLKEAMQQYLNPEMVAEVRQEESMFKKDSFGGEEAYWGDTEWDSSNAKEQNTTLKAENSPQSHSIKHIELCDANVFEVVAESVLDVKAFQSDFEQDGIGLEASVKTEERSSHLYNFTTKVEAVNVLTTDNPDENREDEFGEVESSNEDQLELNITENLSNVESQLPSTTLKSGNGKGRVKFDEELHHLTGEHILNPIDDTKAEDMGSFEKISEQVEELCIGKSVCTAECDAFVEHSDEVPLHDTNWGDFGESNRSTTIDGASRLKTSEENMKDVVDSDLKDVSESSEKTLAFALIEASKPNFTSVSTKPILSDNEVAELAESTDFVASDIQHDLAGNKASIEPEDIAVAQTETGDEQTGYQKYVLGGKVASEESQPPPRGDGESGAVEGLKPLFKVNIGSSQSSPVTGYEEKEASDSVLKQLNPKEEGVTNSAVMKDRDPDLSSVVVHNFEGKGAPQLSEGAKDVGVRPMGGSDDFLDPGLIGTESFLYELDSNQTNQISLDKPADTMPPREPRLNTILKVGYGESPDNLSRRDETEFDNSSGALKTSGSQLLNCTPSDSGHVLGGSVVQPNISEGEVELVLQESLKLVPELSDGDSFKSGVLFASKEQSANQLPDSTSFEASKVDAEDASWANCENATSSYQVDVGRISEYSASSPHEEPSAISWMDAELPETDKNNTNSELGERTTVHESSEIPHVGDSHLGLGDVLVLSSDAEHFDHFQGGKEIISDGETDLNLPVGEEGDHSGTPFADLDATQGLRNEEMESSGADQMASPNGDSVSDSNFSAEKEQTSSGNDIKSLDFESLTRDPPPLSVLVGPLEPICTLGEFDKLADSVKKPLEDVHLFEDSVSGELALKKSPIEPTVQTSFGANEVTGIDEPGTKPTIRKILSQLDPTEDSDQLEFDTKSSGVFVVQEGLFNKTEPTSQSMEPEISDPAMEHDMEGKFEEELNITETTDLDNLRFRTPWRDIDQLGDLESSFAEATGLEVNTQSDEPTTGCKVDSNGSDEWEVDDWRDDSGCLQESSDQFHHADLLGDLTLPRNLDNLHGSSAK
ncbi:leucine rich repeat containing protein 68 [Echinococcus multilocularis]|uniref:Leucine rich repeat containing protein 68 n=1 Tax=Echinococcus multilocularis TaxID=6211 RepID=A0A068YDA5_ECHMU|nr:leucine rich repeat containing protein 68 [Echinococcus multilocularis]